MTRSEETTTLEDDCLYVVNKGSNAVSFDIKDRFGSPVLIRVRKTWIPIDLSEQAHPKEIKESHNFKRAIRESNLQLISTEEARKILKQKVAQIEMKRIGQNSAFSSDEVVVTLRDEDREGNAISGDDLRIINLINSMNEEDAAINQFMVSASQTEDGLSKHVLDAMLDRCKEKKWKDFADVIIDHANK